MKDGRDGTVELSDLILRSREDISDLILRAVMAGLVPAIHVFLGPIKLNRGCPGQARA
jgi:hypothetical protein